MEIITPIFIANEKQTGQKALKSIEKLATKILPEGEDSTKIAPFFALLEFIITNHSNFDDMTQRRIQEITMQMYQKFNEIIVKLKERTQQSSVDQIMTSSNLEIVFKLFSMKLDQNFLKETCKFVSSLLLLETEENESSILENFKKDIESTIPAIRQKLQSDKDKVQEIKDSDSDAKMEPAEEAISLAVPKPKRPRLKSLVDDELADTQLDLQLSQEGKLERMVKMLKYVIIYSARKLKQSDKHLEEILEKIRQKSIKVLDTPELNAMFEEFSDLLVLLDEVDLTSRVKNLASTWFSCYEEDFKAMDIVINQNQDLNKPKIKMSQEFTSTTGKETPKVHGLVDKDQIPERLENFINHAIRNKVNLNHLIRQNKQILKDSLRHAIYLVPELLSFDNKHYFFRQELKKLKQANYGNPIQVTVNRNKLFRIFEDSYEQLHNLSKEEMLGKLKISFVGEAGEDAGGLTREWYSEISKQMFNPNMGMFKLADSGVTYYPDTKSFIHQHHTDYFKFIGRIIAKAILDEQYIECAFVKALYKIIRGTPLNWHDMEDYDHDYYKNLIWMLENDVTSLMQTFSETIDFFGKDEIKDLIPNGRNIEVTNENKEEFIQNVSYFRLYTGVQAQIDNFLLGFYEIIPRKYISIFDHKELELLISGCPNIDIDDLKANTDYKNYNPEDQAIRWFWEIMYTLDQTEKAEFLQFVTGSSRVPIQGFAVLQGMGNRLTKFNIAKMPAKDYNRLPVAHTCFNQLDLPEYPSKELMRERLLLSITEGKGGFYIV